MPWKASASGYSSNKIKFPTTGTCHEEKKDDTKLSGTCSSEVSPTVGMKDYVKIAVHNSTSQSLKPFINPTLFRQIFYDVTHTWIQIFQYFDKSGPSVILKKKTTRLSRLRKSVRQLFRPFKILRTICTKCLVLHSKFVTNILSWSIFFHCANVWNTRF